MDAMLHALGGILLRAVPTFLLVVLLNFYLKAVFFKPLEKVLHARRESTEGARELAAKSLEEAAAKTARYEEALRSAKGQLYQTQESLYKQLQEREAAAVLAARQSAEAVVKQALELLSADVAAAKLALAGDSDALANQIADSILRRSAA
jgi:F-type H+-transporting ATPase subunit b